MLSHYFMKHQKNKQIDNMSKFIKMSKSLMKMKLKYLNYPRLYDQFEVQKAPTELFEKSLERLKQEENSSMNEIKNSFKMLDEQRRVHIKKPVSIDN
mmetsp:Transcript_21026/g.18651  ORF Transcript_21026/g.18651 Transcript_21026/m.18651 type:complete len:97 (+) Transcript_21026:603-893(+)